MAWVVFSKPGVPEIPAAGVADACRADSNCFFLFLSMLLQSDHYQVVDMNGAADPRQLAKCSKNVSSFMAYIGLFPGR